MVSLGSLVLGGLWAQVIEGDSWVCEMSFVDTASAGVEEKYEILVIIGSLVDILLQELPCGVEFSWSRKS